MLESLAKSTRKSTLPVERIAKKKELMFIIILEIIDSLRVG